LNEKKKKTEGISLGSELRKVQDTPLIMLSIRLGIKPDAARLIQTLIRDFLVRHEEESKNPGTDSERPIFFHKSGCQCNWCKLG